jgi:hypothetical protein
MNSDTTGVALYVHCNLEREEYTVTEDELLRLSQSGQNHWKEFGLPIFFFGLPCLLNGLYATGNPLVYDLSKLTGTIAINYLIGIISIILGCIFIIMWLRTARGFNDIITAIRAKPRFRVQTPPSSGSSAEFVELTPENPPKTT